MIRRPPRSTQSRSSAASDVYKRQQLERTRKHMREIVAAHLPVTQAEISFDEGYPPMAPTEGNGRLLALFDAASRDAGLPAMSASNPADLGAADVSFVAGRVKMALDGMG